MKMAAAVFSKALLAFKRHDITFQKRAIHLFSLFILSDVCFNLALTYRLGMQKYFGACGSVRIEH
jgi:hypothetical protein